jgi:drug/metabolite transporter (DMT)-like permease
MMNGVSDTMKGIIFAVSGFSLFALSDSIVKYVSTDLSPFVIAFWLSLFATIVLLVFSIKLGGLKNTLKTRKLKLHILRGVFLFLQFLLLVYAFSQLTMAKTYALVFIAPFIASIISIPLLRQSVSAQNWMAIAAGFVGVLVILRPGLIPIDLASLAALASAFLFALVYVLAAYIGGKEDTYLSFALFPELVIVVLSALVIAGDFSLPSNTHLGLMMLAGSLSAFGMVFTALGFVYAKTSIASLFHYTQIIWAIILGYVIFGDTLDFFTGLGCLIIVCSGIWLIKHERANLAFSQ